MTDIDDELTREYLAECRDHLVVIQTNLLAIEKGGAETDTRQFLDRVYRAVHSVRGVGFIGLTKIRDLAQQMEDVLALILTRQMVPGPHRVRVLRRATDRLNELLQSPGASNEADIVEITGALGRLCADHRDSAGSASAIGQDQRDRSLRILLVEDDPSSRRLLKGFLSRYGDCHLAENGREAVETVHAALKRGRKFDLICMDILMPEMNGREAVRQIRALEGIHGIFSAFGAKIMMTTSVEEMKEVIRCFEEFCDAYLMKPINLGSLLRQMKSWQLID